MTESAALPVRRSARHALRPLVGPLALLAIIGLFGALYPTTFLTQQNLLVNVLDTVSYLIIVAAAQTIVMVVGDFDLSVGGLAALATSFAAAMIATTTLAGTSQEPGFVPVAIAIGLAVGLICGLINGVLVAYLGVMAFIATLGMSVVYTNLARFRVDGKPVYGLVEEGFVEIARTSTFGLSNKVWIALIIAGAIWFLLDRTTLGRRMYAVGGNAEASRYAGIDVRRVRLLAFAFCGLGAAAAGILQAASTATANTTATQSWMLQSIAAVFLGMAMFRGGRPNLPGTVLGVILLRVIDNGLNFTDIPDALQSAISGLVIVIAVLPPAIARLRAAR
ncbi:MAG TPA: ABC transporter permease [Candidatus Limnocylindrales bacterium]|nr:ABC transporter permease [Candidatus Limnocylindrales bacterium]